MKIPSIFVSFWLPLATECFVLSFVFYSIRATIRTGMFSFASVSKYDFPYMDKYEKLTVTLEGKESLYMQSVVIAGSSSETILLLHPNPTWSFLYRKLIPYLTGKGYKIVAPDFIGFGNSDKFTDRNDYSHNMFVESLKKVIDGLSLTDITLFGIGLGGTVGMSVVRDKPLLFKRIILYNTGLPQGKDFSSFESLNDLTQSTTLYGIRAAAAISRSNFPVAPMMSLFSSASNEVVSRGYMAPFPSSQYSVAPAAWWLTLPMSSDDEMAKKMREVKDFLKTSWSGSTLYGYSDREPFFQRYANSLAEALPNACRKDITDSGHYIPEDQPEQLANVIIGFITNGCS